MQSIYSRDGRTIKRLEGVSLDQLRTFITAADEGSFSAAARKLNRVQSAVSGWVRGLEDQFGVVLFDRSGRFPKLTPEGVLLLADARGIVSGVDGHDNALTTGNVVAGNEFVQAELVGILRGV